MPALARSDTVRMPILAVMSTVPSPRRRHVDGDRERVPGGGHDDAVDRRNVGIVAPKGKPDMVLADDERVRRVEFDPADPRSAPDRHPGVGRVRADEALLSWRWTGAQIAADIGGGQPERPQARDHPVGEVLAHAMALLIHLLEGGGHV